MAPPGQFPRAFYVLGREPAPKPTPTLSLHPNRLIRKYRKPIPAPTPLTQQQIEYLVAKANAKTQKKDEADASEPWTAVPEPVPDTGVRPGNAHGFKSPSPTSSASSLHQSLALNRVLPFSTFSPLPPLLTTSLSSAAIAAPTTIPIAPDSTAENQNNESRPSPPRRLPGVAISLIVVAGVCVCIALLIAIRLCVRPTRRSRPVPSRPIFKGPFPEDDAFKVKLEDSPVFGGQERLSERPGPGGLWQWTQYSATPATTTAAPSTNSGLVPPATRPRIQGSTDVNEKIDYPFTKEAHAVGIRVSEASTNSMYPAPVQQVHTALTRAASRLSTVSASMYPGSPSSARSSRLVTSFTADGHSVLERVNPKVLQRSRSSTLGERNQRGRPQSRTARYSCGFPYDGAEVMSPKLPMQSPTMPITPGRTRIMSSYYAHPRTSNAVLSNHPAKVNVRQDHADASLHHKSESRTVPVTALGFASPAAIYPLSPQPTLYPDDSLSFVEAKRHKQVQNALPSNKRASRIFGREEQIPMSPTQDATAALGNLMLIDFGGTSGKQSANNLDLTSASSTSLAPKKMVTRSDDKPPRVPSPPPLPSLTQMGLEHADPEAYAEYRSPTYSIYNLYETRS